MTPTAEWYEAAADDSNRSITYDASANTHETARAATETGETGAGGHGDPDLLRKRTAALDRVAAENERLRGEVERLRGRVERASQSVRQQAHARSLAEAKLRDVEALADEWERDHLAVKSPIRWRGPAAQTLRAVLARSQAPQGYDEDGVPIGPGGVDLRPDAADPEPQSSDGPEYHAEHAYWLERQVPQPPQTMEERAPAEQEGVVTPGATPFTVCCCLRCGPPFRGPGKEWRAVSPWQPSWMALCPTCGDKRCPGAIDHRRHQIDSTNQTTE